MFMGRGDPANAEWARLRPHLPKSDSRGGRWAGHRRVINAILYRNRTGVPWPDLPARFGSGSPCTSDTGAGRRTGTWDRVFAAVLADTEGPIDWPMVSVDSTSCRAHQHAAGAHKNHLWYRGESQAPAAPH
ncbi:transposase [Streptomyces sp. NPDC004685]